MFLKSAFVDGGMAMASALAWKPFEAAAGSLALQFGTIGIGLLSFFFHRYRFRCIK
jgi:hypothetical protein